jgi:hypothetical protein
VAATAATLSKVTMTVPPGTGGTPGLGAVTPTSIAGGSVALSGTTLTYSFTAATVPAGTVLSIQVTGLTNTTTTGSQTSTITTDNGTTAVDTGTAGFAFSATALTSPGWSTTSTVVGTKNVSYTYTFTPSSLLTSVITQVTMTVPPGTTGTPAVGSVSPSGLLGTGAGVTLSGTTLTVTGLTLSVSQAVSIQVTGLTNTYTAGEYVPEIATYATGAVLEDSGVTPAVTFPGGVFVTVPPALSWSGTLNGLHQALADTSVADEPLVVNDQTNSGDGWHLTVTATSFTNSGGYSLPDTSALEVTGSVTNIDQEAAPTASCLVSSTCTVPNNVTVTYPVTVSTAPQLPTPEVLYDAFPDTGIGPVAIGGPAAANPLGWWVNVPGNAASGTYTATVAVSVVSGP